MGLVDRLAVREAVEPGAVAPPELSPTARQTTRLGDVIGEVRTRVHQEVLDTLGPRLYEETGDEAIEERVHTAIGDIMAAQQTPLTAADRTQVAREVADEILGHGPIEPLLRDPDVTEIMVNSWDRIYIERFGQIHAVDAAFTDESHLRRVIDRIVSRVGRR